MIEVLFSTSPPYLLGTKEEKIIKRAIGKSLEIENIQADYIEVSVSIVGDQEIRILNRDYRNLDRVTDVLSFPLEMSLESSHIMLGDIVINMKRLREQALEFGHSEERELTYLTVHSVLHLLGYDHLNEEDRIEMRMREKAIMASLEIYKNEKK